MSRRSLLFLLVAGGALTALGCGHDGPAAPGTPVFSLTGSSCENIAGTDVAQFTSATTAVGTLAGDLAGTFEAVIDEIRPGDEAAFTWWRTARS